MRTRAYTCQDCGKVGQHLKQTGCVPKRCEECRRNLAYAARREWYVNNRDHALRYASERHFAKSPRLREKACELCGDKFTYQVTRGSHAKFCPECIPASRKLIQARFKEIHREKIRLENREYMRLKRLDEAEREKARSYAAEWRAANPELARARRIAFYARHAERLRERSKNSYKIRREALYERDGGCCHICGMHVRWDEYEVDHIIPVARGGSSESGNVAVSHMRGNRRKGTRLVEELAA